MRTAPPIPKRVLRRDFPGRRWLSVVLRGLHLLTVMWLAADILGAPRTPLDHTGIALAVFTTGMAQFVLDLWTSPQHLREVAGASVLLKLLLVAAMAAVPAWREPLFWAIVVWSVLFSHAPASFRHALLRPSKPREN